VTGTSRERSFDMATGASNRRSVRTILIHRPMQRMLTLTMIGVMMTAGVLVSVMIHFTLKQMTDGAPQTLSRLALERIISDVNLQLIMGTIFVIFLAVIVLGFFGVFFLHRVAGPVYRIRQVLRQMASGELPPDVHLREHDFFHETAAELNRVIHVLRGYAVTSKKINALLTENRDQESSPEVQAKIAELCKELPYRDRTE